MNPIYAQLARQRREATRQQSGDRAGAGDSDAGNDGGENGDWQLFFERSHEVDSLYRILNHRKGGRSSMVMLYGAGSCGKTTLVRRSLLPKFRSEFGGVFQTVSWIPRHDDGHLGVFRGVARALIDQLPARLDADMVERQTQRQLDHFELLLGGEAGEAAEYLAALFREANADEGPAEAARCVLFFDQFDRFFPGGLIANADEAWVDGELLPLVSLLYDLALTNAFPLIVAVRSYNIDGLKQALLRSPRRMTLDWTFLEPLPPDQLAQAVESDTALPEVESALVDRCEELLSHHPGALAFVEAAWHAQEKLERPPLTAEFFDREQPLEKYIAGVAETVAGPLCDRDDGERILHQLLNLFFPISDGEAPLRAIHLPLAELARRPAVAELVETLIDARVLVASGESHDHARVSWAVPRFFRHWERGFNWLQKDRDRREAAQRLEIGVTAWEKAERTAVLLLHGSESLKLAHDLLDYHADRPFLSPKLKEFLEASVATDARLRNGRERSPSNQPAENGSNGGGDSARPEPAATLPVVGHRLRQWWRKRRSAKS